MSDTSSSRSVRKLFSSVFPPPEFLSLSAAGLDISSRSVKVIALAQEGPHLSLREYANAEIPEGVIEGGDIVDSDALVEILRRVRSRHAVRYVHASLPEKKAFLYQARMPQQSVATLHQAIESELEEHVPLPPSETYFDFETLPQSAASNDADVAVTAYARRIVESYVSVLERAGLTPVSLEVESQALARAVVPRGEKGTVMAVDFGKYATRVAFIANGQTVFTATIDIGGHALTSAIMKQLNVKEEEAERLKNEQGLIKGEGGTDLSEALMITVTVLKDELMRHLSYWNERASSTSVAEPVSGMYLCGGNANLRGLPEYLAAAMRIRVSVANVWTNAFSFNEYVPDMPRSESLGYATAIGLALKSF